MGRLENKVAIVTGGARGLGKTFCLALAEERAKVVVADILEDEAELTAQEIRAKGGLVLHLGLMLPLNKPPSAWLKRQ